MQDIGGWVSQGAQNALVFSRDKFNKTKSEMSYVVFILFVREITS